MQQLSLQHAVSQTLCTNVVDDRLQENVPLKMLQL